MTALLSQNAKMKLSLKDGIALFNFGIPAFQSKTDFKTCPMAGTCSKGCYATKATYTWPVVTAAYEYRLEKTQQDNFVELLNRELRTKVKTAKRKGSKVVLRVHDSGDYYNLEYILKWFDIMEANPEVLFYSYTKMVPLFKKLKAQGKIPKNFIVVYSEGGIADHLIDTKVDKHCRIFETKEELDAAGYLDVSKDDSLIFLKDDIKCGIVYHGAKANKWATA